MNKTLTDTLFDEITTRDEIITDLTTEKDIVIEQLNAAVDALNEACREIDRLTQPSETVELEGMVNDMLDMCICDDCEEDEIAYDIPVEESKVRVNFEATLDSVIAGTLVKYDSRPGTLSPSELLQLVELKNSFKPSAK